MNSGKYEEAIIAFELLGDFSDSKNKITECNDAILRPEYDNAIALINAGQIVQAYDALIALGGYNDSAEKAEALYEQYPLNFSDVGDYITFGKYEQDNNITNGKEDIEWLVLDKKDGKVLIISIYSLDYQQYNTSDTDVTWETCTLRKWLNGTFLSTAFSEAERAVIPTMTVSADRNPKYSYTTYHGNATQDKVFLLSITEANKYFNSDSARMCEATAYAEAQAEYAEAQSDYANIFRFKALWWWLRSPGGLENKAAIIDLGGNVSESGQIVSKLYAVRPALWISVE